MAAGEDMQLWRDTGARELDGIGLRLGRGVPVVFSAASDEQWRHFGEARHDSDSD